MPVECPNSLITFFPPEVYRNIGACDVLPTLVGVLDRSKLETVQFLRNGAVRLTFKDVASCDDVLLSSFEFNGHRIRVTAAEQRSRLVYVRDLPSEVTDDALRASLRPFGEVHSIRRSEHDGFPGLFDGSRVVKMSLSKDIPNLIRLAGFDCRIWYRRQPPWCPICSAPCHRGKECPLNGVCRRCRQPGHVARHCRRAWGGPAPKPARKKAPAPAAPASGKPVAPAAAAGTEGANSSPPGDAPAEETANDVELVSESSYSAASDGELLSGDEEILAEASVSVLGSPSSPCSTRAGGRRKRKRSRQGSGAPAKVPSSSHVYTLDLTDALVVTDEGDGSNSRLLKSHQEVWTDTLQWEEIRAIRRARSGKPTIQEPSATPGMQVSGTPSVRERVPAGPPQSVSVPTPAVSPPHPATATVRISRSTWIPTADLSRITMPSLRPSVLHRLVHRRDLCGVGLQRILLWRILRLFSTRLVDVVSCFM